MSGIVPPPDPAYFWDFTVGQTRVLGYPQGRVHSLRLDAIEGDTIAVTMTLGTASRRGTLYMDRSEYIVRDHTGEAMVTATLRRIESGKAYLQMTAHPRMQIVARQ